MGRFGGKERGLLGWFILRDEVSVVDGSCLH